MSHDVGKLMSVPRYVSYEYGTFGNCKTIADTTTDLGEESTTDCYSATKKSVSSLKQNSTPSPSYPAANSWPGFGGKQGFVDDIQVPTVDSNKSPSATSDTKLATQRFNNPAKCAYVFTSAMANEAAACLQQKKYESIIAWHEANCRPSTSKVDSHVDCQPLTATKKKRRSTVRTTQSVALDARNSGSPLRSCGTPSICSPSSTMLPSSLESGNQSVTPTNIGDISTFDETVNDNPLRRMEKMTQDSIFEPPSKVSRIPLEPSQPAKREQERNAKLEKMRTLEQQIMYDKARSDWDRMVHEHEAIKMARGFAPSAIQACPIGTSAPYNVPNGTAMQAPCRRNAYMMQQVPTMPLNNGMLGAMPNGGSEVQAPMPMSQPLRPSLNAPNCAMQQQYPSDPYMCCGYPNNAYPAQSYATAANMASMPTYYQPPYAPQVQSRDYGMYSHEFRPMCPPEKMAYEMWNRQLPQHSEQDNRIASQKLQYHPNGMVIDGGFVDSVSSTNTMFV